MTVLPPNAALHELRKSAGIEGSVEILGPMLQQFDLLALAEALEVSIPKGVKERVETIDRFDGVCNFRRSL